MRAKVSGFIAPVVLATLVVSNVGPASAQTAPATPNDPTDSFGRAELVGSRRYILGVVGLAAGVIPAVLFADRGEGRSPCSSHACLTVVSGGMGALAGYLIGRDLDHAAAVRAARGPELRLPMQRIELELLPEAVDAYEAGAIVIGGDGIVMVGRDKTVRHGGTIRGIRSVAPLPSHDAVLAVTTNGLYSFPLSGSDTDGRLVMRGEGVALEAVAADQVVLSGSNVVRRLRLSGRGRGLELAEEARAESQGLATALAFAPQTGIVWEVSGDRLIGRSTQLEEIGSIGLPATGRTLSISGDHALVSAGAAGLFLLDIQQPSAPRMLGQIQGIGYAFDAVLDGTTAYVAGGRRGLVVLDVTDPAAPRVLGAVPGLGFVSSVALAPDGQVYVADREGGRLYMVQPRAGGQTARQR